MSNNKLFFSAIRALPEKWIDDETRLTVFSASGYDEKVIAANPKYLPMEYINEEWKILSSISKEEQ